MNGVMCRFKKNEPELSPGQGEYCVYRFDLRAVPVEAWETPEQPGEEYDVWVRLRVYRDFLESGTWPNAPEETRVACFTYHVRKELKSRESFPTKDSPYEQRVIQLELHDTHPLALGPETLDLTKITLDSPFEVGVEREKVVEGFVKK